MEYVTTHLESPLKKFRKFSKRRNQVLATSAALPICTKYGHELFRRRVSIPHIYNLVVKSPYINQIKVLRSKQSLKQEIFYVLSSVILTTWVFGSRQS